MSLNSPFRLRLGQRPPDSAPPEIRAYLEPIYNAFQQIQNALVQFAGIAQQDPAFWSQLLPTDTVLIQNMGRLYVLANEDIAASAIVNIMDDGAGGFKCQNANATNDTKPAHGFATGAFLNGTFGEVILGRGLVPIAGLTPGTQYFLSKTNGLITAVKPVAAGNIEQYLGFAFTATLLMFTSHYWIKH